VPWSSASRTCLLALGGLYLNGRAMAFWSGVSSVLQVALSFGLGFLLDAVAESNGYMALGVVGAAGFVALLALLPRTSIRLKGMDHTRDN
jgi:hypothetical protein